MKDYIEAGRELCKALWHGLFTTREVKWYWFVPWWLRKVLGLPY